MTLFTRFVGGMRKFICLAKEVSDLLCVRTLFVLHNLIMLFAFHVAFNTTDPHA